MNPKLTYRDFKRGNVDQFTTLNFIRTFWYKLIVKLYPRAFQKSNLIGKENLTGAEVGVYHGENAYSLLKHSDIKKLYLIDPYEVYKEDSILYTDLSESEINARKRLKKFEDKIEWIKKYSDDAIDLIPNNLDFIYIDGNHKYEFVKKDIANYFKKVKKGGVLAGHDFIANHGTDGVIQAVIEFAVKNKLRLYVEGLDWWVIK